MLKDWTFLSDDLQLMVSREALRRAADAIAAQADMLAEEMDCGALTDRGGPEALRLLAAVVRASNEEEIATSGHA